MNERGQNQIVPEQENSMQWIRGVSEEDLGEPALNSSVKKTRWVGYLLFQPRILNYVQGEMIQV